MILKTLKKRNKMKFNVPEELPDLILYIWKIVNLPYIKLDELIYKISFEMLLLSPEEAEDIINKALKANLIIEVKNDEIKLSDELVKKLNSWQKRRKKQITENFENRKTVEKMKKDLTEDKSSKFTILMKLFLDKGTLNRAATISDNALNIIDFNPEDGIIETEIKGSKEEKYLIKISINDRELYHNCHDYKNNRAKNKKFCKHLAKLFLYLKKKDEKSAISFLQGISKDSDDWTFSY